MAKTEEKIIKFLSLNPNKEFYGAQIAAKLKCSKGGASATLKKLAKNKMITVQAIGSLKFYQINSLHPRIKNYKIDLALKEIDPILDKLKNSSNKIILFGSASRGEQDSGSDIDLLIVTRKKEEIAEILKKRGSVKKIKPIIKTQNEWLEMELKNPELYKEINKGLTL